MPSEPHPPLIHPFGAGVTTETPGDAALLGGKGAGLHAMSRAGLPVPPGFVIGIPCCRYVHEHEGRWPDGLADELHRAMAGLEERVGRAYGAGAAPLLVSVRSGAAHSMPGMMDTILNCGLHPDLAGEVADPARFWSVYEAFVRQFGRTVAGIEEARFEAEAAAARAEGNGEAAARACIALYERETGRPFPADPRDALRACIDAVFSSWDNARAIIYRRAHKLEHLEGTAVTVQAMFDSEVSGIAFTANPSNPAADEIIIESAYGLGESIVSGDVAPDRFVIDAKSHTIKAREIGRKDHVMLGLAVADADRTFDPEAPSLTDEQVGELVAMAVRVEEFFGHPVDIEWGLAGGKLVLLQSRAIRGLDVARDVEIGREQEILRLHDQVADRAQARGKVWVIHNLAETLNAPTAMTWDILGGFMKGDGGFGRMYQDLGYRPSRVVREQGFLELICGRIYADVDRTATLFWDGMPFEYDHEAVLADPRLLEAAPTRFEAARSDETFLLRLPGFIAAMIRSVRRTKRARRNALERFEKEVLPPYLEEMERWRRQDLAELETPRLIDELHTRIRTALTAFGNESLKPGFFGGAAQGELEALLTQVLGPGDGPTLTRILCSGLEDTTVDQNQMLFDVAQGRASMDDFLAAYGHRAVGEMELARPRWNEDASYLEQMIESQRGLAPEQAPAALHAKNRARRDEALRDLPATLAARGGGFLHARVVDLATEAQRLLPYRETGKHYLLMGYAAIRRVLVELGRRTGLGDDIFHLRLEELPEIERRGPELADKIRARAIRRQAFQRLDLPDVIDSRHLDDLGLPRDIEAVSDTEALPLSPGVFTGTVRIVFDPAEARDLPPDTVLVCPSTDPGWTALFTVIRGLIVERGGVLSHGAITARDFSIPAVACPDATRTLRDGARVRVDGDRGRVTLIEV